MIKFVKLLCLLLISTSSLALQAKLVTDNSRISVNIAKDELNRIKITDDRISQIFGLDDSFNVEVDEKSGQIFIKPSSLERVHVSLITERGKSIDLALTPKNIPPETVVLYYKNHEKESATFRASPNSHTKNISNLIKAMYKGEPIRGYSQDYRVTKVGRRNKIRFIRDAVYDGADFVGEIYTLKNTGKRGDCLQEKDLFKESGI